MKGEGPGAATHVQHGEDVRKSNLEVTPNSRMLSVFLVVFLNELKSFWDGHCDMRVWYEHVLLRLVQETCVHIMKYCVLFQCCDSIQMATVCEFSSNTSFHLFTCSCKLQTESEKKTFITRLSALRDLFSPLGVDKVRKYEILSQLCSPIKLDLSTGPVCAGLQK